MTDRHRDIAMGLVSWLLVADAPVHTAAHWLLQLVVCWYAGRLVGVHLGEWLREKIE